MEIVKFSACPGTSKLPLYTCPQIILLARKNKYAYTSLCLNYLLFQKNIIKPDTNSCKKYRSANQLASLVNNVDSDQLASEEAS